ncbi:hypothetical protein [Kutzneria chonburiensis]|uniref:Secreted protein n=1 Tax=Kutzneria chonburiensis TaxID=1483604 RepID=A0ABV6MK00_9PSEU|nr:hypothetical protein [Kutzneria chonburiensis]
MRKRTTAVLIAGAALALLAGCATNESAGKVASLSSSNPTSSSSAPAGGGGKDNGFDLDKIRGYAKCMRDHGVDMPDPDPNGGRLGGVKGDPNDPKVKTAMEACKSLLPNGGAAGPPMDAAAQDHLHKEVQCMRDHGVHMKEPGPDSELEIGGPGDDPAKVEAAMKACGMEAH